MSERSLATKLGLASVAAFALIQLVPYGRDHTNPPTASEPQWNAPATRELFLRACGDCHSHETRWPWYSQIAPASWLVQHDVDEGRSHFNVSDWLGRKQHGDEAAELLRSDEMPPLAYRPAHPEARLSDAQRDGLIAGLIATFGDEAADGHEHHQPVGAAPSP